MQRLLLALAATLVTAGCAPQPAPVDVFSPRLKIGSDFVMARHVDRRSRPNPEPWASGANVLFLNFDGVSIGFGTDDAATNTSELASGGTVNVPAFALPANSKYTLQQGKDSIADRLRAIYKPFDVNIVTSRPAAGDYTMIAVGGKNTIIPGLSGAAGVSTLDCDATTRTGNPDNIVYDFSDEQPPSFGGLPSIAITAAHESGHAYGLEHTDNPADIMFSVANACNMPLDPCPTLEQWFAPGFTTGNYSSFNGGGEVGRCAGRTDPLDNVALLNAAIGANPTPGDLQAPTVSQTFPIFGVVPPGQIPIRITASDNNKVQRVEVFKNFELIAVLTTAPYQTTVSAADQENFAITADAFDADANHKAVSLAYLALAAVPPLCPNGVGDCKAGQACKQGICRYPIGTPCSLVSAEGQDLDIQCEFSCKKPMGQQQTICTNTCNAARPCPAGNLCGPDNLCAPGTAPMPKVLGEVCAAPEECASMRCQDTCVAACDDQTPCADGMTCGDVGGGRGCVVATEMPMPASGGCDVAPAPTGAPLFLLMLLGFLIRRRTV